MSKNNTVTDHNVYTSNRAAAWVAAPLYWWKEFDTYYISRTYDLA